MKVLLERKAQLDLQNEVSHTARVGCIKRDVMIKRAVSVDNLITRNQLDALILSRRDEAKLEGLSVHSLSKRSKYVWPS